jgi:imidazolonepropionase
VSSVLHTNIGELLTNDPAVGAGVGRLIDAAFIVENGCIAWVGSVTEAPVADERVDHEGRAVVPGFVDSHTHLVFAGERSDEYEARLRGERYDGGGIRRTVAATRAATEVDLHRLSSRRAAALRASGVTTLEVKSGYDLTVDGEARLLGVAQQLTEETTFLGAHTVPEEFAGRRDDYVDLVRGSMLGACAPHARWIDVFCDQGAFDVDESRAILAAGRRAGLQPRLHGNQLGATGGIQLAVESDAASVDHCTHASSDDLEALASSDVVATLLPSAEFFTNSPYPSLRRFVDAGVTVALATDCNPGTSYVTSMPFVLALAVAHMGATVDEALWAATAGGAHALRRSDVGVVRPGARADFIVVDAPRAAHLVYHQGIDAIQAVYRDGLVTTR